MNSSANTCELQFTSRLIYIRPVLAFMHEMALACGLNAERAQRLQLATEEVLSNIIRHGYAGRPDGQIGLQCSWDEISLTLAFVERGLPFDFSTMPTYDPKADAWDPTGLGMHLARQCVDEVQFENLGQGGKLVRLVVHRHEGALPFEEMPSWDNEGDPAQQDGAEQGVDEVQVRRMEPADAVSLAQCAYRTWGYGYNDFIYVPEEVRAMLADGRLESVVALREGRVIGHTALKKRSRDERLAEAGVAFVDPEVRSQSIMGRMVAELSRNLPKLGLEGLYAMQVTSHKISQKVGYAQGFKDCGLLLRAPARPQEDARAGAHAQRRSAVVMCFRPLGPQRTRCVYPPPHLRGWVERAYAELGLPIQWGDEARPALEKPAHTAHVRSSRASALRTADIEVLRHGSDTLAAIAHASRMHHRVGVDAVFLHLNLESPETAALDAELQALGFVFAAVLPCGLQGHDALILQSVNLKFEELDAVQLLNPFPKDVLQMVRQQMPPIHSS